MAKTIVDSTGQMRTIFDSRKQQLEKQYDLMEDALRKGEVHFTKNTLAGMYGLATREVWGFLKVMEEREVLAKDNPILNRGYSEQTWHIVARPVPKPTFRNTPQSPWLTPVPRGGRRLVRKLTRGTHLCDRCGSIIPGRGRHNKSARGHTTEVCDLAMVKVIHET